MTKLVSTAKAPVGWTDLEILHYDSVVCLLQPDKGTDKFLAQLKKCNTTDMGI